MTPSPLALVGSGECQRLDGTWCVAGKGSVHLLRGSEIEHSFPAGATLPATAL